MGGLLLLAGIQASPPSAPPLVLPTVAIYILVSNMTFIFFVVRIVTYLLIRQETCHQTLVD